MPSLPSLTAHTRVAGVIGDPVGQSLSPTLHNAAYAALGLDWVYVAFPVPAGQGAAAVAAMRTFGVRGLSVTMPHKAAAAAAVDRLSPTASRLGVLNTVTRHGDDLLGDSTDGPGLLDALRADNGWEPAGRTVVILGTGGAARAVALSMSEDGAASVVVVGRRPEMAAEVAALAGSVGSTGTVEAVAGADLVVNATPVGMLRRVPAAPPADVDPSPAAAGAPATTADVRPAELPFRLDPERLGPGQLVADLVYAPPVTPLQIAARRRGAQAVNGLGMLIHQAARQFAAWTGEPAPIAAMAAAAEAELARRSP